jgi:hypothetical protein
VEAKTVFIAKLRFSSSLYSAFSSKLSNYKFLKISEIFYIVRLIPCLQVWKLQSLFARLRKKLNEAKAEVVCFSFRGSIFESRIPLQLFPNNYTLFDLV